jgi:hypothetical protein
LAISNASSSCGAHNGIYSYLLISTARNRNSGKDGTRRRVVIVIRPIPHSVEPACDRHTLAARERPTLSEIRKLIS